MNSNPFDIKSTDNFQELMANRVHEILLVASPYDAFILEEDGGLSEQVFKYDTYLKEALLRQVE